MPCAGRWPGTGKRTRGRLRPLCRLPIPCVMCYATPRRRFVASMRAEVFEAFRSIDVPEDKALKAAEAIGRQDDDIKADISALKSDVGFLKTDVAGLRTDVAGLRTDVAGLKTDVAGLRTDVAGLKTDVAGLKTDVGTLKTDVATLKTDVAVLKWGVALIVAGVVSLMLKAFIH